MIKQRDVQIYDLVIEALLARGWSMLEAENMLRKVIIANSDKVHVDMCVPFGMYKGKSISYILEHNIDYLWWMLTIENFNKRYPDLMDEVRFILGVEQDARE